MCVQPKEIKDIRDFVKKARAKDAKLVKVKKTPEFTKFKLRLSKHLFTLRVSDKSKSEKIEQSFPPSLCVFMFSHPSHFLSPFSPEEGGDRQAAREEDLKEVNSVVMREGKLICFTNRALDCWIST